MSYTYLSRQKPISAHSPALFNPDSSSHPRKPLAKKQKQGCACGGGCPRCRVTASNLVISQPNDTAEIEADRIAEKVLRMPAGTAAPNNRPMPAASIQNAAPQPTSAHAPAKVRAVEESPGTPLDAAARTFFEPRLGYDLGDVRIHTDGRAAEAARSVDALAYTLGRSIVFGADQYQPQTHEGRRLMAHELAHVIQGRNAAKLSGTMPDVAPADSEPEVQADTFTDKSVRRSTAPDELGSSFTPATTRIYRAPTGTPKAGAATAAPRRVILIDANIIGEINRGNTDVAATLNNLRKTSDVYISQQAYAELTSQPGKMITGVGQDLPRWAVANKQLLNELGIKVAPAGTLAQRTTVYEGNLTQMAGNISEQDVMHAGQAKAIGAEIWSLDRVFRKQGNAIQKKLGVQIAPETYNTPFVGNKATEDYRVARRIMGLEPLEITVGGNIKGGGGPPSNGGGPPSNGGGSSPGGGTGFAPAGNTGGGSSTSGVSGKSGFIQTQKLMSQLEQQSLKSVRFAARVRLYTTAVTTLLEALNALSTLSDAMTFASERTLFGESQKQAETIAQNGKAASDWADEVWEETPLLELTITVNNASEAKDKEALFDLGSSLENYSSELRKPAKKFKDLSTRLAMRAKGLLALRDGYGKLMQIPQPGGSIPNVQQFMLSESFDYLHSPIAHAAETYAHAEYMLDSIIKTLDMLAYQANQAAWHEFFAGIVRELQHRGMMQP